MWKTIGQFVVLVSAIVIGALAAILITEDNGTSNYLDASNFVESDESKKFNNNNPNMNKNDLENSFLGSGMDNFGLYKEDTSLNSTDISDYKFSGNLSSFNKVTNDAMNVYLWENDFSVVNLVIKTKGNFSTKDLLSIEVTQASGLKVQSGFLRYISAVNNAGNTNIAYNPGTAEPLWVPDAITNDKHISMTKNNVYIYRIRIDRNRIDSSNYLDINIKANDKIIDKKRINIIKINKQLKDVYENSDESVLSPSFNIINFPTRYAGFYNEGYANLNGEYPIQTQYRNEGKSISTWALDSGNDIGAETYIDWNWDKYWKKAYQDQIDNFGMGSYFYAPLLREDGNNSNGWELYSDGTYKRRRLWEESGKDNAWFIFKIKDGKLWANDEDWLPLDDYIYKMGSLGYKHLLFNDFMYHDSNKSKYFYEWNDAKKEWEVVIKDRNFLTKEGYNLNLQILEAWLDHVNKLAKENDNYKYNWFKKFDNSIDAQFYIDEGLPYEMNKFIKMVDQLKKSNKYKKYAKFIKTYWAIYTDGQDRAGNWTSEIGDVDTLYFNTQSMYNYDYERMKKVIAYRNEKGLISGQYQLDSHSDFDLCRAEPGELDYEMLLLNKNGEPRYMKYSMAGWTGINNYYSADVRKRTGAGDSMWEYPSINNFNDEKLINDQPLDINPSVRLEQLAYGVNLIKKINSLPINKDDINKYLIPLLGGSHNQSGNKFNFQQNKINIKINSYGLGFSYIDSYLKESKSKYGEVDAAKKIEWLVDEAALKEQEK